MSSKKSFYLSLGIDALFEGGRMFAGATSGAYLLSQGLGLSEIALLKSVQASIILLGEVPTGILADSWGHKRSLLFSLISAVMGFALYYFGHSFLVFVLAEALVALALCFWSGAYEAFAIEEAALEAVPGLMDRYFHLNQAINSGAVLVFGYLGGRIGLHGMALPYLGAVLVLLFAFAVLVPMRSKEVATHVQGQEPFRVCAFMEKSKAAFREGLLKRELAPFFWANIGIQFAIQPLLHYWQPLFQSLGREVTAETLGTIFSLYCGTNLLFGMVAARLSKSPVFRSRAVVVLTFVSFGAFYVLTGLSQQVVNAVISFCFAQGLLSIARTALSVRFNEAIAGLPRASILSSLSLVSRFGMIGALGLLSVGTKYVGAHSEHLLFVGFGGFSIGMSLVVGAWLMIRNQMRDGLSDESAVVGLAESNG